MLGQNAFQWIDKRLRQATAHYDEPFLSYSLVIVLNCHQYVTELAGSIAQLSPIKRKKNSKPYFDGHLSDGTTTLRFIGFDEELHSVLKSHHSSEDSVILTKCNLAKANRDTDRSPVAYINKGKTTINKSPKKFKNSFTKSTGQQEDSIGTACTSSSTRQSGRFSCHRVKSTPPKKILLEQLTLLCLHNKVDVSAATVLKVHHPIIVGYDNKIMQKVFIADNTGNTTIQLWGDEISTLKINKTYNFTNVVVKEVSKEKYEFYTISTHREVSSIGKVVKPNESKCNEAGEVEVIAVNSLISEYRCIARGCNSKVKNTKMRGWDNAHVGPFKSSPNVHLI